MKRENKIDYFSFFDKGNAICIVSKNSDSLSFNPDCNENPFSKKKIVMESRNMETKNAQAIRSNKQL